MTLLVGTLLVVGCEKPKPTAATVHRTDLPPPLSPVQQRLKLLTDSIKPGITDDDVVRVAGEPKMAHAMPGSQTPVTWQYELGDGTWFVVRFDKHNRVSSAEPASAGRAQ